MYYDKLSTEEKQLVLHEVESESKNILIAYLLLFLFGGFGIHNFYLGNKTAGIWQAGLTIVGYVTTLILIGFLILPVVGVWVILDAFRIPSLVENDKLRLREEKAEYLVNQH